MYFGIFSESSLHKYWCISVWSWMTQTTIRVFHEFLFSSYFHLDPCLDRDWWYFTSSPGRKDGQKGKLRGGSRFFFLVSLWINSSGLSAGLEDVGLSLANLFMKMHKREYPMCRLSMIMSTIYHTINLDYQKILRERNKGVEVWRRAAQWGQDSLGQGRGS